MAWRFASGQAIVTGRVDALGHDIAVMPRLSVLDEPRARARESATGAVLELMIDPDAITPKRTLTQIRNG